MCLLSYFPEGIIPNEDELWNGAVLNNDGHGYAIATRHGELITGRGLNPDHVISDYMSLRRMYPDGPSLFHSRWGTGGGVTTGNCHPFQLGRDRRTVVAHNGVFFSVGKRSKKCDTRIFAEHAMPERFRNLDRPGTRKRLEKYLGDFNKLAVITVNPRYRHQGYLFNEGAGTWTREGTWHSNKDYLGRVKVGVGAYTPWWDYDKPGEAWQRDHGLDCDFCGAKDSVDDATLYCTLCRSCQSCGDVDDVCLCYVPQELRDKLYVGHSDQLSEADRGDRLAITAGECDGCTSDAPCSYCAEYLESLGHGERTWEKAGTGKRGEAAGLTGRPSEEARSGGPAF